MQDSEEIAAVRQEIYDLLRLQMEALDSPLGLTDERLSECYDRQSRVQELREKLQALTNREIEVLCPSSEAPAAASKDPGTSA
jgi:hypothetical protein